MMGWRLTTLYKTKPLTRHVCKNTLNRPSPGGLLGQGRKQYGDVILAITYGTRGELACPITDRMQEFKPPVTYSSCHVLNMLIARLLTKGLTAG